VAEVVVAWSLPYISADRIGVRVGPPGRFAGAELAKLADGGAPMVFTADVQVDPCPRRIQRRIVVLICLQACFGWAPAHPLFGTQRDSFNGLVATASFGRDPARFSVHAAAAGPSPDTGPPCVAPAFLRRVHSFLVCQLENLTEAPLELLRTHFFSGAPYPSLSPSPLLPPPFSPTPHTQRRGPGTTSLPPRPPTPSPRTAHTAQRHGPDPTAAGEARHAVPPLLPAGATRHWSCGTVATALALPQGNVGCAVYAPLNHAVLLGPASRLGCEGLQQRLATSCVPAEGEGM
jgi:hypothetical protein